VEKMSESLLSKLRNIVSLERELTGVHNQALGVIVKSDDLQERVGTIAAIAVLRDARQSLKTAFDSLDVHKVTFDELLRKSDDDLVRAVLEGPGASAYALREGVLGGAASFDEVRAGLNLAFSERLEHVVLQRQRAERLLGNQQD
jgi:hypothetical protein